MALSECKVTSTYNYSTTFASRLLVIKMLIYNPGNKFHTLLHLLLDFILFLSIDLIYIRVEMSVFSPNWLGKQYVCTTVFCREFMRKLNLRIKKWPSQQTIFSGFPRKYIRK